MKVLKKKYALQEIVLLYPGAVAAWHFVPLPKKQGVEIKKNFGAVARGWGSHRVLATIGKTSWKTSIFWDNRSGTYLLPLKLAVRQKEMVAKGDKVKFTIVIQ